MKKIFLYSLLLIAIACKTSTNSKMSEKDKISLDSSEESFRKNIFDKEFKDTTTIK